VERRRSNMDTDGIWLFRVGDLRGENVQVPGSRASDAGNVFFLLLDHKMVYSTIGRVYTRYM